MTTTDMEVLLKRYVGILSEDFQHKLNSVIDGQQFLAEKLDRPTTELKSDISQLDQRLTGVEARLTARIDAVEKRLDTMEVKLDAVADDLAAHRADTEAHHGLYLVKEE